MGQTRAWSFPESTPPGIQVWVIEKEREREGEQGRGGEEKREGWREWKGGGLERDMSRHAYLQGKIVQQSSRDVRQDGGRFEDTVFWFLLQALVRLISWMTNDSLNQQQKTVPSLSIVSYLAVISVTWCDTLGPLSSLWGLPLLSPSQLVLWELNEH